MKLERDFRKSRYNCLQLLFLCTRVRQDIKAAVAFLMTLVKHPRKYEV
jgi:hypothetical protein